ncbi:TetR family transcriptional regulator [Pseudolysinimonas sp.]
MRRDSARNRQALLDAARRVFEARGVDAPLEEIADAAGLSRTSLHRHFSSRTDLLAEIWADDVAETEADAERFSAHPDAFLLLFDATMAQQVDRRSIHPDAAQIESPEIVALAARFVAAVESTVRVSRAAGVLRADLSDEAALRTLGMAITAVWGVADRDERVRVAAEVRGILFDGIRAVPAR